jgi:hypothetical protein
VRAAYVVAPVLLLALGGCSSLDAGSPDASGHSDVSTAASALADAGTWNPCADLAEGQVGRALGARVRKETGSLDTPRCAFLPEQKGGPTLNVTYTWFTGGFERAWRSMGELDGVVRELDLRGADHARLVVSTRKEAVLVTGFAQTGDLVETVNAAALAPYDRAAVMAATTSVLATLVDHAPASPEAAAARG